ncbi:sugar phosphate isomerase/epimerase [Massilimaliae timonensis]|uniref:Sugar phosphate isomerase/epimerase n=2 Tax=Massiliimalia timonensis TaxID=1987501 RepID=A0A8J6P3B0_9FIRM|nr:sugar phosphate isomerase/epimerase [Massiliimalia timonensis]
MRIGANCDLSPKDPGEWVRKAKELRCEAVSCPVDYTASAEERKAYREAAERQDILIAEVGVWNNPIALDEAERKEAIRVACEQLALADEMGACCCVNVMGAAGPVWDGCYSENMSADVYQLSVETVRKIIDAVKPTRTCYTIEPMPWMVPDSPEACLKLLKDVDRKGLGVHLDYTNMINSIPKYFQSSAFIKECFRLLGPFIKSIHAKDIIAEHVLPCHIHEVMPGWGTIDYSLVLKLADQLGKDMPVLVEHLETLEEYQQAVAHLHSVWQSCQ